MTDKYASQVRILNAFINQISHLTDADFKEFE